MHAIFSDSYFWNDNVCFFVLIYEMEQFKQKMERGFSLCFSAIGTVFILIRKQVEERFVFIDIL